MTSLYHEHISKCKLDGFARVPNVFPLEEVNKMRAVLKEYRYRHITKAEKDTK